MTQYLEPLSEVEPRTFPVRSHDAGSIPYVEACKISEIDPKTVVARVSDWVVTLDRNMGIEFFDHGGKPGRPDYLIDHSPAVLGNAG